MEEITTKIKELVLKIYPNIISELANDSEELLDLSIDDAINRVLAYTNRTQLIAQYEKDLLDDNVEEADYVVPIPKQLWTIIAKSSISALKSLVHNNSADTGSVKSISDNGQSITYSEQVQTFFSSSSDSEIFSDATAILNNFRLATVVENTIEHENPDGEIVF